MELKQFFTKTVLIAAALWIAVGTANSQTIGTDAGYVGTGAPVGALPLALDVSPMGAATGSMPFDLPAGFGNVTPQLGLVYSSSLGLGNMGYGFALSGVSSITVAGQDYWHDGNVTPVNFNGNDRFYLDGVRLILESGTYGANGAKYLTESYNFATITSTGSTNSQPVSFTVVTKDGTTMEYGGSAAIAKVSSNGTTKTTAWLIKKITDKRENYIEYTYSNTTDGQIKLTEIKYAGNSGDNIQPQYTVKITYGTRAAEYSYVSGYKVTNSLYVTAVAVTDAANTEIVKYTFSYSNNKLTAINKYYMGRLACNPTKIGWNNCDISNDPRINNGTQPSDFIKNNTKFETFTGDVDGDMQTDVVRVNRGKNGKFAYYTKQGNSLIKKYEGSLPVNNQYSSGSSYTVYESRGRGTGCRYIKRTEKEGSLPYTFFDIDNDGTLELCVIETAAKNDLNKTKFCVYKLNSSGLTELYSKNYVKITNSNPFFAGNFDGTGHIDLVLLNAISKSVNSNNTVDLSGINGSFIQPFELNGDCKTEIISLQDNAIRIFEPMESRRVGTILVSKISIDAPNIDPQRELEVADFNGDGLTDILVYNNGWKLYLNTGGQFSLQSSAVSELNASRKVTQGRQQVTISASPTQRDYDTGGSRITTMEQKNAFSNIYKVADFDGDGRSEILRIERDVNFSPYDAENVINTTYRIKIFKLIGGNFTCVKTYSTGIFTQVGSDAATITTATDIDFVLGNFEYCAGQLVGGCTQFEITDYNEDGFQELLVSTTRPVVVNGVRKESSEITLQFYSGRPRQFISSVTDGMGVKTSFSYGKLNSSNYTRSSETHSGGVYSCPLPLWVVSGKKTTAGNITASNISYSYEGLLLHKQRGMLGFEITLASDAITNLRRECTFNYNPTYIVPYLEEKRIYYGSNHTLGFSEFGYDFKSKGTKCYIQQLANDRKYDKSGKNVVTTYSYNGSNDLSETITKYGNDATDKITFENYTTLGKPQKITTQRTQSSKTFSYSLSYTYDSYGNTLTETDSRTGVKTSYSYDSKNHTNVTSVNENDETGLNTTTTYTYDATKRFVTQQSVKYKDGPTLTTSTTYDNLGRPLTETDYNGLQTKYQYDNFGQLAVVTSLDGDYSATAYGWTNDGSITNYVKTKNRLGDTETIYYDALGREIKRITSPAGGTAETVSTYYLNNGKVNYTQSSINGQTSYTYEEYYGDISGITSRGRTVNYLSSGMTQKTTVNGVSTAKTYNNLGQIKKVTDAASAIEYTYHPCGSPLTITAAGATTSMEYDDYGRQTKLSDPDAGTTTYEYDRLGRLTKQKDARGVTTSIVYDKLGREIERTETQSGATPRTVTTTYYTTKPHIGLVKSQTDSQSGITTSYTYDGYGRLLTKTDKIDGKDYKLTYGYDSYGRHIETTYPSGEHLTYAYSGNYLVSITDQSGTKLISEAKYNARGQLTSLKQGNGNTANYTFNSYGYPTAINYGPTSQRITYGYSWNATTQNLTSRSMGAYTEMFGYDAADRLTTWTIINSTSYTANYSGNGNIVRKSDFGLYAYNSSKPHAVSNISSLIAGTGEERTCEAEYNTIGKIKKLTLKNGSTTLKTATFTYAADGQRRKMQIEMQIGNATTIYVDNYQVNKNGNTEQRLHYISGPAGLCALIVQNYNGSTLTSRVTYYLQTDYQGSIIAAYNSNGTLYKRFAYDPWGRRRAGDNWTNYQTSTETLITRGYCGHEHLDDFGTINMNGRIYDPRLGRFLSPDPYVQAPYNSQNYNRYSYCLNNPLKYTDPSGEYIWILPNIGWSKEGGFNLGISIVVGIPGEISAQLGVNYNFKSKDFTAFLSGTYCLNTVYVDYSTKSGWGVGYTAGLSIFSGFPINTNFTTTGINYNISDNYFSGNISAWQSDQKGNFNFNPSFSAVIFPESTTNLFRGQGFRSNDAVLQRFVNAGEQQKALDYFRFKGTYDPKKHKTSDFDAEDFYGCTNIKTGEIYFGNLAFDNYATLLGTYMKELYTSRNVKSGRGIAQLPSEFKGLGGDLFLEEINGYIYAYKNQGLYRNCSDFLFTGIYFYQSFLDRIGMTNIPTYPQRFRFIYKIPRLW